MQDLNQRSLPSHSQNEFLSPKAVPDISAWQLFPGTYVVGNSELDRYVVVPAPKLSILTEAISYFDGFQTIKSITTRFSRKGQAVDVLTLYQRLLKAGLLADSEPRGELSRLALPLFDMEIGPAFNACQSAVQVLFLPLLLLTVVTVATGFFLLLEHHSAIEAELFQAGHSWSVWGCTLFGLAMTLSLLAHELAHGFTATWLGLRPRQFAAVAYLAVMPIFFLKIPGIYTLSPGQRVQVWISGVWINLTIASTALIATQIVTMPVLYEQVLTGLAVSNGFIVAWNLVPFLPTDGYFIMCTLLKKPNIRPRAWQEFSRWIRLRVKPSPMLLLYFGLSLLTTLGALLLNATWAYRVATHSVAGFVFGCLLILSVLLGLVHLVKSLIATRKPEGEGI